VAEAPALDKPDTPPDRAPGGASVSDVQISSDRFRVFASYTADGFDSNTALVNVWYYRALDAGDKPFDQIFPLDQVTLTGGDSVSTVPVENGDCLPGGDYRVDVYAGTDLVGTGSQHINDSPLGTLVVAGGEDVGFTLCHPDDWTPPPTNPQPGSLAFANPKDPTQFVIVSSFPIGAGTGVNGTALLNATVQSAIDQTGIKADGPPVAGEELLGRTAEGADVTLGTTTVTGTTSLGDSVRITGSVGSDDVVRMVIISAANPKDLDVVRSELVNSVRFLRVVDTTQSGGG
jgi:hypothetical protein